MAGKNCCPNALKPITSSYVGSGLSYYLTGNGPRGVVMVYDIFGFSHPNAYQVADAVASSGFTVIVPDFFRQNPWPAAKFPPEGGFESPAWAEFQGRMMKWDAHLKDVETACGVLHRMGIQSIGGLGMCWGGKVCMLALGKGLMKSVASPHPSSLELKDVQAAKGPVMLLPGQDDPEMADIQAELKTNAYKAHNAFHKYSELSHGFLGARGYVPVAADYSNETTKNQAQDALNRIVTFLNETL